MLMIARFNGEEVVSVSPVSPTAKNLDRHGFDVMEYDDQIGEDSAQYIYCGF